MEDKLITIRAAEEGDAVHIQRLLHSDSRNLSIKEIHSCVKKFQVLFYGRKLLGVTYFESDDDRNCRWTSVHPMFSQCLIERGMAQILKGVWRLN